MLHYQQQHIQFQSDLEVLLLQVQQIHIVFPVIKVEIVHLGELMLSEAVVD
jgi:hypothetical protein